MDNKSFEETTLSARQDWHNSRGQDFRRPRKPLCLATAYIFGTEFVCDDEPDLAFTQEINQERVCPEFTEWIQSLSPKEHREMQILKEQRERDLAWQEARRKEDAIWRIRQEEAAENRWQKENKLQRYQLVIVGIIGTVVIAAAQIIGSLIQANASKDQPPIIINLPNQPAAQK